MCATAKTGRVEGERHQCACIARIAGWSVMGAAADARRCGVSRTAGWLVEVGERRARDGRERNDGRGGDGKLKPRWVGQQMSLDRSIRPTSVGHAAPRPSPPFRET